MLNPIPVSIKLSSVICHNPNCAFVCVLFGVLFGPLNLLNSKYGCTFVLEDNDRGEGAAAVLMRAQNKQQAYYHRVVGSRNKKTRKK